MIPFVDLFQQNKRLESSILPVFQDIIRTSAFTFGKELARFEQEFARYIGVTHCIGVASGTDALTLGMRALGIGKGDEVILLSTTFIAAAEAVAHTEATPIFTEIDLKTRNMPLMEIKRVFTKKTKAILLTHLYGQPIDPQPVLRFARAHNLFVIEDVAQAHGAMCRGARVGSFGDIGCFSFYPGKNLGAFGDGGAVVTNNTDLEQSIRRLRNHGCKIKYQHEDIGYNSRLDNLQAAVLVRKLPFLDRWNGERQQLARMYDQGLEALRKYGVQTPPKSPFASVYHLYVIEVPEETRDALRESLLAHGVETGIHYLSPIPSTRAFLDRRRTFPVAEAYCRRIVSLPLFPGLKKRDLHSIVRIIQHFYDHDSRNRSRGKSKS